MDKPTPEEITTLRKALSTLLTARRIKEMRSRAGLTQEQFGELTGCSKQTVSLWEKGLRSPSGASLTAIAYFILLSDNTEVLHS